jgi:Tol biopolymer transport system component
MFRLFPLLMLIALLSTLSPAPAAAQGGCDPNAIITRVSMGYDGSEPDSNSTFPSISGDGRYIVFQSGARNLTTDDNNILIEYFLYDRSTCQTLRIPSLSGGGFRQITMEATINDDGRWIAFSERINTNGSEVFLYDRQTGITSLISAPASATHAADSPFLTGDARYLTYARSWSSGVNQLVTLDRNTDQLIELTPGSGSGVNGVSFSPAISDDGQFTVFISTSTNLVPDDTNGFFDVFLYSQETNQITRLMAGGEQPNGNSYTPAISDDGSTISFMSRATNLVPGVSGLCTYGGNSLDPCEQIYRVNRQSGEIILVTRGIDGRPGNGHSSYTALSEEGRYLVFLSKADNLVAGDTNNTDDVFVYDHQTGVIRRVSVAVDGSQANDFSLATVQTISDDGRYITFWSRASNLLPGDNNQCWGHPCEDIFVVDWQHLPEPPPQDLITNGDFAQGMANWATWDAITHQINSGVFEFYRNARGVSAVVLQATGAALPAHAALTATFKLGNTSPNRKRVVAIIHDSDWSDQLVCSFWIPPNTPLRTYTMTAATGEAWTNTTLSFYGSPAENIGWIQLDDVSLVYDPALTLDSTQCVDPSAPGSQG